MYHFQLLSSCNTIKNVTLEEMYPGMCTLIDKYSELCDIKTNNDKKTKEHKREVNVISVHQDGKYNEDLGILDEFEETRIEGR